MGADWPQAGDLLQTEAQSRESILQDYPSIIETDIHAALELATQMTRFESFDCEPMGK